MAERSIGARILAARRARGYRSTRDLAAAMPGSGITESILENIESGRKADLAISQVLNLSHALGVPLSALLAPLSRAEGGLDLPNLGEAFAGMNAAEFDAWITGDAQSAYRPRSPDERNDRAELSAFRQLTQLEREIDRLKVASTLYDESIGESHPLTVAATSQMDSLRDEANRLREFLRSAGWQLPDRRR